ncbi:MAG: hypothetical protein IJR99_11740 [Kiritimatiellae bacterium]|nr:hypothetical protein [Kiritimatiellia bacterium]
MGKSDSRFPIVRDKTGWRVCIENGENAWFATLNNAKKFRERLLEQTKKEDEEIDALFESMGQSYVLSKVEECLDKIDKLEKLILHLHEKVDIILDDEMEYIEDVEDD